MTVYCLAKFVNLHYANGIFGTVLLKNTVQDMILIVFYIV